MPKPTLTISFSLLVLFIGFLCFNIVTLKAQQASQNFYDNSDLGLEDMMSTYHKHVNDTFNAYTQKMLTALEKDPNDPNGKAPENSSDCLTSHNNFSTFCLAANLLGDPNQPDNEGYLNYKNALEKRRNQIFDTAAEKDAWNTYINATTIGQQNTQKAENIYQTQKILSITARSDAIDREISSSKQALDKTLAAYDQLRLAWPMHKEYVRIFDVLTQYRDNLAELRHQTDDFPARFVDVTSTKCT